MQVPKFDIVLEKGEYGFIKTPKEICKVKVVEGILVVEREPREIK